jgi:hypothetical protein
MALTKDRNTPEREIKKVSHPLAASTKIYAGSMVALDASGNLVPGATATTLTAVGRAEEQVDNSAGLAGALSCLTSKGTFLFGNDGSIDRTHVGKDCYIVDDQTVAATNGTNTRSLAGKIVDLDGTTGVWVLFA